MLIGSHNSWSYLRPRKWWMRLIGFTARCQRRDIYEQYEDYGVRCFDLRVRFRENGELVLCHGLVEYDYSYYGLLNELEWLNSRGTGVVIRLLLDLRGVDIGDVMYQEHCFNNFYNDVLKNFTHLRYILGRMLPSWKKVLVQLSDGSVCDAYSSVRSPKFVDDWFPWLYARLHNREILSRGTDCEILLIDFVDIR